MISKTINLDYKTSIGKFSNTLGYKDVSEVVLDGIRENKKLKYIQLSRNLPLDSLEVVDLILSVRPDLIFRIYGMYNDAPYDLTKLKTMRHLKNLHLELLEKKGYSRFSNLDSLGLLKSVKSLYLNVNGNVDLSFIETMDGLESLYICVEYGQPVLSSECFKLKDLREIQLGKKAAVYLNSLPADRTIDTLVLFDCDIKDESSITLMNSNELHLLNCTVHNLEGDCRNLTVRKIITAESNLDNSFTKKFPNIVEYYNYSTLREYEQTKSIDIRKN
ncbi:MAG: hypothetical protein K6F49_08890 [Saccharofermentans sp.]|nr:hypothetical protein [Saccharofermentans sp.]